MAGVGWAVQRMLLEALEVAVLTDSVSRVARAPFWRRLRWVVAEQMRAMDAVWLW
jgi:hypothetical protein